MKFTKKRLLTITQKAEQGKSLRVEELEYLCSFEKVSKDSGLTLFLKRAAVPASLAFGFFFTAFPEYFNNIVATLPAWTNFPPPLLTGVDYLWDLLGEPVGKANILYHLPNVILYSFGIFGIKKLFDVLDRRTWLDRVIKMRDLVKKRLHDGSMNFSLQRGHSILFVGKGDFIATQFVINHKKDNAITISETIPAHTSVWCYYNADTTYEDLKDVLKRADDVTAGEYIFFPVKDDQIFLPSPTAYDLSPYKLDILCQNIRMIERQEKWKAKRIIIIGDKNHLSFVQSEDQKGIIKNSEDIISLDSISKKYTRITLVDPTSVVIKKIIEIADGRRIVIRATKEGLKEYKTRFFTRLQDAGYRKNPHKKGILTIGYDLFEDQTEQQTLSRKIDDYYPVVLSKNVRDALVRNGYKTNEFLYVPELVLATLTKKAAEQ